MTHPIRTDRLTLRAFQAQDLAPYAAHYTGPRAAGTGAAMPPHVVVERFCAMIGHWTLRGFGRYAICLDPAAPGIGHVGPMQLGDDAPEMTWTLWSADHEGQGFATEAARAVLDHLFTSGWSDILAHVEAANTASHAVARRLGGQPTDAPPAPWMPTGIQYRFTPEAP